MSAANAEWARRTACLLALVGLAVSLSGCATTGPGTEPSGQHSPTSQHSPTRQHSSPGHQPGSTGSPAAAGVDGRRLLGLLGRVRTSERSPYHSGYDRACTAGHACVFGEAWTDLHPGPFGRNGCDTRQDVLLTQMHDIELRWGSTCRIYQAWLVDPYTGERLTWRDDGYWIQIDHIYPLAEAWHAGAWAWPEQRRLRFANDVRRNLLAVSARANDTKGAATPSEWLPPNRSFRCGYAIRYLRVALAYHLSVTTADAATMADLARHC